jgi:mobilization protein NikA
MARYNRAYDGELRTAYLGLKLTPSERSELDAAAALQGASPSDFAREMLFRRASAVVASTRRHPEAAALVHALNDVGNLLNQIARHLNTTGELRDDDPELLTVALDQYKLAIAKVISL